jgi:putative ABC transport system substrate-binding protein
MLTRVGVLNPFAPPEHSFDAFRAALNELGYIEDQNLHLEIKWAHGRLDRLPELARELIALKPDDIFAIGEQGLLAVKNATTDTPIVALVCDPLDKFIDSLAKPGGIATGVTCVHSELTGKRLQLMKELIPNLTSAAALYNSTDQSKVLELAQLELAGKKLGIAIRAFPVSDIKTVESAFTMMAADHVQALLVLVDAFTIFHRRTIADLALASNLPMGSGFKEFAEAGAVLSYGTDRSALYRRAAAHVDRVIKGTNPGDIPVEEPTRFELFINQKTASALKLDVPRSILVQANHIIE